jgi:hypothetical protein
MSPFMTLYGYHPPSITSPLKHTTKIQAMEDHIGNQLEVLKLLKYNLVMAHSRMKLQADQHHNEMEFEAGDWVILRIQSYKQTSLNKKNKDTKLTPRHYDPYKVLQRIGSMDYKLEFPPSSCVHPIFNVSFLNKVNDNKITIQTILPMISEEGKIILEP